MPDLATSLPTPTDGGKTYAFQLRKGIRFSNGCDSSRPPTSARRSSGCSKRTERRRGPRLLHRRSVGGAACVKQPASMRPVGAGSSTDDKTGTVTFHLTAPDPEFLYKLAIPFASILPAGTPFSKSGHDAGSGDRARTSSSPPRRSDSTSSATATSASGIRSARPAGFADQIDVSAYVEPPSPSARSQTSRAAPPTSRRLRLAACRLTRVRDAAPRAGSHARRLPPRRYWFLNTTRSTVQ